jgi:ubiquinone/menaquinone biosynthesis C-methylase UbiE
LFAIKVNTLNGKGDRILEFRKIFDSIPEKFDKWRPKYCKEAFDCIIDKTKMQENDAVLEIGPGTGQATEPILKTGCDYTGVELGEHFFEVMKNKFRQYKNFHIINGDFENYDFAGRKFNVIYSAAAIQWIPENIAFSRSFELLKPGGYLAMMMQKGDYKTPDEDLYEDIEKVYTEYFHPIIPYSQKMNYANAANYGFTDFHEYKFESHRQYTADEYIQYIGTHSDHIILMEPEKSKFFDGIKAAVIKHGNIIRFNDTIIVYITRKPEK